MISAVSSVALGVTLRRLYFIRFAFALLWAALVFTAGSAAGPLQTVLLVLYPLVDAGAVLMQIRSEGDSRGPRPAEQINVILSTLAAIALAWASTVSTPAVLLAWGAWAIVSGLTQLVAAIIRRKSHGQVPLMISGGISILAGGAFAAQGLQGGGTVAGVGGYAVLGGIFFLIAAIRLSISLKKVSA
ncbi:hypothetical protein HF576_14340 [Microbacterium sp. CFH 90308]|uniref:Integral membrane protein n=1 Tax=Microbacterium salsuginis TaxID=2722803 RepID=A0ABX1KGC6_9MICO|nr:DUF308 domain-containing protein [Microbacterium sp. CFH 90308]NLP85028.1 hypothetical protein [Microbacterium sp. CFH 90308]